MNQMGFVGNVGKTTEEQMINDIKNMHDTYVIVSKEEDMHYQEFKELNKFIRENYEKVDEISGLQVHYIQ